MLVAEGATEAALDLHSKAWDLAPLGLIVEEAGGRATDVTGKRSIYSARIGLFCVTAGSTPMRN